MVLYLLCVDVQMLTSRCLDAFKSLASLPTEQLVSLFVCLYFMTLSRTMILSPTEQLIISFLLLSTIIFYEQVLLGFVQDSMMTRLESSLLATTLRELVLSLTLLGDQLSSRTRVTLLKTLMPLTKTLNSLGQTLPHYFLAVSCLSSLCTCTVYMYFHCRRQS